MSDRLKPWLYTATGLLLGLLAPYVGPTLDFLGQVYMPHTHCYGSDPRILYPWLLGDIVTFLAYVSIPALLCRMYRKQVITVQMTALFGAFIVLCGVGHLLDALAQSWWPAYALRAYWGMATAGVSVLAAGALWRFGHIPEMWAKLQRERDAARSELKDVRALLNELRSEMESMT